MMKTSFYIMAVIAIILVAVFATKSVLLVVAGYGLSYVRKERMKGFLTSLGKTRPAGTPLVVYLPTPITWGWNPKVMISEIIRYHNENRALRYAKALGICVRDSTQKDCREIILD